MRKGRTIALAALSLAVAPLLVGCDAEGRIDVHADRTASVNLTYYPEAADDTASDLATACRRSVDLVPTLTGRVTVDPGQPSRLGCKVEGYVGIAALGTWLPDASQFVADGRFYGFVPSPGLRSLVTDGPEADAKPGTMILTVSFPGTVLGADPTAQVAGNTVTWTGVGAPSAAGWQVAAEMPPLPSAPSTPLAAGTPAASTTAAPAASSPGDSAGPGAIGLIALVALGGGLIGAVGVTVWLRSR